VPGSASSDVGNVKPAFCRQDSGAPALQLCGCGREQKRQRAREEVTGKPAATAEGGKASEGGKTRRARSAFPEETKGALPPISRGENLRSRADTGVPEEANGRGGSGSETSDGSLEGEGPEGKKLRSVAGAKQTRRALRVVERPVRRRRRNAMGGPGGAWQLLLKGPDLPYALKSRKSSRGLPRAAETVSAGFRQEQGSFGRGLAGAGSSGEELDHQATTGGTARNEGKTGEPLNGMPGGSEPERPYSRSGRL
jgi:hypothetical protein